MKKISLLVLLVFAVIVLINCGSSGDSKDDKTNEEPEEQNCEINDPDKDYIINISKSNPFDSCIEDYKTLTFIFDDIGTYQITATSTEIPYSCGDSTIEDYKYHRFPMEVVNGFDSDRSYKTPLSSALNRKFEVVNAVNSKIVMGRYLDNNKDNYNCYGDYWHEEQSIFGDVKIEFVNSNIRMGTKGNPETVTDTDFPISGKLNADSDFIDEDTSFEKGNTSTTYFYIFTPQETKEYTLTFDPQYKYNPDISSINMEDDDYSKVNIYKIIEGSESNDFIATINCEDESSEQIDIEEDSKYLLSIYLESYDEGMDFSLDIE